METWRSTWQPIRGVLRDSFPRDEIRFILLHAGLSDLDKMHQHAGGGMRKDALLLTIDSALFSTDDAGRENIMARTVCEVVTRRPESVDLLDVPLRRLGLVVVEGEVVPLDVLDPQDLESLPPASHGDLVKAAARLLRDGDPDSAITNACGAVESATGAVYEANGKDGHAGAAFQEKVKVALQLTGILERTRQDLLGLGWEESKAKIVVKNLEKSLNTAALVMQQLRRNMGDVHGSKPTIEALAFESVKWAEILTRMLSDDRA